MHTKLTLKAILAFTLIFTPVVAESSPATHGNSASRENPASLKTAPAYTALPAEELAAPFCGTEGFIGGDGVYSIPLGPDRILWLFGDSFIGRITDGGRPGTAMVNNIVGISRADWANPDLKFHWRIKKGKPRSFFEPGIQGNWFWPLHGFLSPTGKLYVFLIEVTRTGPENDVFAFGPVGNFLAVIDNPEKDPPLWRVDYRRIEFFDHAMTGRTGASEPMVEVWGNWVLQPASDKIWIYGITHPAADPGAKRMRAAKVPADGFERFAEWEFMDGDTGLQGPAMEISAFTLEDGRVMTVYPKGDMANHVWCSIAPGPAGPFGPPWQAMELPPPLKQGQFAYAVKAHPWVKLPPEIPGVDAAPDRVTGFRQAAIAGSVKILVTYIFNSFRFEDLIEDARVYTPRTAVLMSR